MNMMFGWVARTAELEKNSANTQAAINVQAWLGK